MIAERISILNFSRYLKVINIPVEVRIARSRFSMVVILAQSNEKILYLKLEKQIQFESAFQGRNIIVSNKTTFLISCQFRQFEF